MAFFDPTRAAYRADPYPSLARLRTEDPVHWSTRINAWVPTRYAECAEVLHDSQRFTTDPARTAGPRAEAITFHRASVPLGNAPTLGTTSGAAHRELRNIVNPVFAPAAVRRARPMIDTFARSLVDAIPAGEPFDLMEAFANPLPKQVMLAVMGFPQEEADGVQRLFATIEAVRANPRAGPAEIAEARTSQAAATASLERYLDGGLPADTVLSALLTAGTNAGLGLEEITSLAVHIGAVGTGPTSGGIANAAIALATHPATMDELRRSPERMPMAIHELLRYDSPTHIAPRFAAMDTTLGGRRVHRGDAVLAMAGAANRDPIAFPQPDEIDLSRDARRQLGFGQGEHICLGAPLALAIVQAALGALLARFECIELLGAPEYAPNIELRIPDRVPLRVS
ncbi:MAG: cytochrome P450 [Dehalococcoidia bacterium]